MLVVSCIFEFDEEMVLNVFMIFLKNECIKKIKHIHNVIHSGEYNFETSGSQQQLLNQLP